MLCYSNSNRSIGGGVQQQRKKKTLHEKTNVKCIKILCRMKAKMFIIKLFCTHIPAANVERDLFFFLSSLYFCRQMIGTRLCVSFLHLRTVHTADRRNACPVVTSKSQVNYSTFFLVSAFFHLCDDTHRGEYRNQVNEWRKKKPTAE